MYFVKIFIQYHLNRFTHKVDTKNGKILDSLKSTNEKTNNVCGVKLGTEKGVGLDHTMDSPLGKARLQPAFVYCAT